MTRVLSCPHGRRSWSSARVEQLRTNFARTAVRSSHMERMPRKPLLRTVRTGCTYADSIRRKTGPAVNVASSHRSKCTKCQTVQILTWREKLRTSRRTKCVRSHSRPSSRRRRREGTPPFAEPKRKRPGRDRRDRAPRTPPAPTRGHCEDPRVVLREGLGLQEDRREAQYR